jgi:hypothetical protein
VEVPKAGRLTIRHACVSLDMSADFVVPAGIEAIILWKGQEEPSPPFP